MREKAKAWVGTGVFLLLAPGVVAGVVPWWISGWRWPDWGPAAWIVVPISAILIVLGVVCLLSAFIRFAAQGVGTPAPIAPTRHLVVTGVYRYVRNPMYLAVLTIILGQALLFANAWLVLYATVVLIAFAVFVRGYEEPTLRRQFGDEYERYRGAVPGWFPRFTPYRADRGQP